MSNLRLKTKKSPQHNLLSDENELIEVLKFDTSSLNEEWTSGGTVRARDDKGTSAPKELPARKCATTKAEKC